MSGIAKNLKQLRLSKNYTQEEVAGKIGLTRQAISSYESGRTQPSVDLLMQFANIYEVELEEILYGKRKENRERKKMKVVFVAVMFVWVLFRMMQIGMVVCADQAYYPMEDTVHVNSQELEDAINLRFEYLDKASLFEGLSYKVFGIGGLILLVMDLMMKKQVSVKTKCMVVSLVALISLGIGWIGGLLSPVYKGNFMLPFYLSAANMLLLLLIDMLFHWIKDFVRKKKAL